MNKITTFLSSIFTILGFGFALNAQCPAGEVNITVDVSTDDWGYECYWEYTPQGNACGTGTLGAYGNIVEVGCLGAGMQVATAGGYADNTTITETLGCMVIGTCFDIHYVDDWGDGGATFEVFADGVSLHTFVGAGVGGIFTVCVSEFDAEIVNVEMVEYTMIPLTHAIAMPVGAEVRSSGTSAITNVVVTSEIFLGPTSVNTQSSTPIATLASGSSQTVVLADYTPVAQGIYTFEFTASMTEADGNPANDVASFTVNVNDTVMARDNGIIAGTLGIGAGPSNGRLGQSFTPGINDNITSATAVFGDAGVASFPTVGDNTRFMVYSMVGGTPTTMIAQSDLYTFTAADAANGVTLTLPFTSPVPVIAGTEFLLCVTENANNVTLATTSSIYTPGTNWVTWDGNPNGAGVWSNSEAFGFNVQFVLRPNFGPDANASIAEQAFNVGAYPNPTTGVLTLDIPSELVGEQYNVLDQTGRVVAQGTLNELSTKVNMTSFDQGMYIVKIDAGNVTLNVIKQ